MEIVVLDGYTLNPGDLSWIGFEKLGNLRVYDRSPADCVIERIGTAEAVIVNKTPITGEILAACPGIQYIGVLATGYNVVDTEAAGTRGIPVTNIPTYGTGAVAQMVFAHLLAVCHRVEAHSAAVYKGEWAACPDFCFWKTPLVELAGKTMGIIGFGRIGQAVAGLAEAFGMKVLAYDVNKPKEPDARMVSLDELLSCSDVISLHCPLLSSTEGMINSRSIAKMKDGVILINASRGPLVAERDLSDALCSGKVGFACLDVVSSEPIHPDNPLLKAKNCHITPHIAWAPKESRMRLMDIAVKNLESFMSGSPVNAVNQYEALNQE